MDFLDLPSDPLPSVNTLLPFWQTWPYKYSDGPLLDYHSIHPEGPFGQPGVQITLFDLQRHYQNWLFFGLLHEFFGGHLNEEDFVRYEPTQDMKFITMRRFSSILRRWHDEQIDGIQAADPTFSRFHKVLEEVERVLEMTERFFPQHGEGLGLQIDVICAIAETFTNVLKSRYEMFDMKVDGLSKPFQWLSVAYQGRSEVLNESVERMIKEGGWCTNDAQRALDRFRTVEAWHYLRHVKLSKDYDRHAECELTRCVVITAKNESNIPRHTHPKCRCKSVGMNPSRLTRIYRQGQIPCLHFSNHEDMTSVRLQAVTPGDENVIPYCALSHVWSDGTGNGYANSLPKCQLSEIYQGVSTWWNHNRATHKAPLLLWIDTMCCPHEQGEGKRLALSMMKTIYSKATSVHVWDRSLLSWLQDNDDDLGNFGHLERGVRLVFSPWMRRLWTAQEAIFGGNGPEGLTVIHYANGCEPLTGIYRRAYQDRRFGSILARSMAEELLWLSRSAWPGSGGKHIPGILSQAAQNFQHRTTSVPSDEPLVLANILGLGGNDFIGLSHEDAMCKFWTRIQSFKQAGIPHNIVFCPTPKLMTKGFRWAPRSLLDPGKHWPWVFYADGSGHGGVQITPQGLRSAYAGFRVLPRPSPRARCLLGNDLNTCGENFPRIAIELRDGNWLRVKHSMYSGEFTLDVMSRQFSLLHSGELAMIMQTNKASSVALEPTITHGYLLQFVKEENGILFAACHSHVGFEKLREYPQKLEGAARDCAMDILSTLDRRLKEKPTGADIAQSDQAELFDQHTRQYLKANTTVCETIESNSREDLHAKRHWTFDQVLDEFRARVHHQAHTGLIEVVELPEQTEWCLD
ncbi:hypothetical protein H2198_009413 [Neophaeococcomyces mojaviensis]|uniref:Uncharacterized protein n=1 Tax=Neophaeococcomyces mojaviensis TaxID=3383035 RepID=A0ACC2ZUI4_9EURO|nr:hypothetical protein H2198_009413 [Knufia sp. JES_112]